MSRTIELAMKKVPRQRRAEVTVMAMIEAADELLSNQPYDRVTTNRIAERAGVGIGSLYQYFPNKEAVVARVVERWVQRMIAEVRDGLTLAAPRPLPLGDAALAVVSTLFDVVERHRARVLLMVESISFARDIPAVAAVPQVLLAVAAQAQASIREHLSFPQPAAAHYVLGVMVRGAIIEAVMRCPPQLLRRDIECTIADFIARIMHANAASAAA